METFKNANAKNAQRALPARPKPAQHIAGSILTGSDHCVDSNEAYESQPDPLPALESARELRLRTGGLVNNLQGLLSTLRGEDEAANVAMSPARSGLQGAMMDSHENISMAFDYIATIDKLLVPVLLLAIVFAPALRAQSPRSPEVIQAEIRQHVAQAQAVAGTMAQLQEFQAYIHEQQVVQQLQQELAAAQQAKPAAKPEAPKKEK